MGAGGNEGEAFACYLHKPGFSRPVLRDRFLPPSTTEQHKNTDDAMRSWDVPIFECNSNCACSKNCATRVVQQGLYQQLEVFHTENKGWGVRTLQPICKGTHACVYFFHSRFSPTVIYTPVSLSFQIPTGMFVCEYAGEVISTEEATHRFRSYEMHQTNYLFVVREHMHATPLCIRLSGASFLLLV